MPLTPAGSAAAQATSSDVAWLPLLTFKMQGGDIGSPVPNFDAGPNVLYQGQGLRAGESIVSNNRWYRAVMQFDGNFVVYSKSGRVVWASYTRSPGAMATFQQDGNFVIYSADGVAIWDSKTTGGQVLAMQDDGNLIIRAPDSSALWHVAYSSNLEPKESTLRVVANTENVISRGQVFFATHFDLILPSDDGESFPFVEIKIANVDGALIQGIRAFPTPPEMLLEIVLSNNTEVVERSVDFLVLRHVEYNALTITGKLAVESTLTNRFPAYDYAPPTHPGLFA